MDAPKTKKRHPSALNVFSNICAVPGACYFLAGSISATFLCPRPFIEATKLACGLGSFHVANGLVQSFVFCFHTYPDGRQAREDRPMDDPEPEEAERPGQLRGLGDWSDQPVVSSGLLSGLDQVFGRAVITECKHRL